MRAADADRRDMALITRPITIEPGVWINPAAWSTGCVTIGRSALIAPRTLVDADVRANTVRRVSGPTGSGSGRGGSGTSAGEDPVRRRTCGSRPTAPTGVTAVVVNEVERGALRLMTRSSSPGRRRRLNPPAWSAACRRGLLCAARAGPAGVRVGRLAVVSAGSARSCRADAVHVHRAGPVTAPAALVVKGGRRAVRRAVPTGWSFHRGTWGSARSTPPSPGARSGSPVVDVLNDVEADALRRTGTGGTCIELLANGIELPPAPVPRTPGTGGPEGLFLGGRIGESAPSRSPRRRSRSPRGIRRHDSRSSDRMRASAPPSRLRSAAPDDVAARVRLEGPLAPTAPRTGSRGPTTSCSPRWMSRSGCPPSRRCRWRSR